MSEVQRRWKNEFGTPSPTRTTVTKIRDKFELMERCKTRRRADLEDPTVQCVIKVFGQCYGPTHNLQGSL
jgi:hypothetical protein